MDILLKRTYYPTGTNGEIQLSDGTHISFSIELPWKDNARKISCIPEGRYQLVKYVSPKHGPVLLLKGVPNRSMVEIHEANWAMGQDGKHPQLEGCIAPVTTLDKKPGVGWRSGDACNKLEGLVFPVLKSGKEVWLTISKK